MGFHFIKQGSGRTAQSDSSMIFPAIKAINLPLICDFRDVSAAGDRFSGYKTNP
jgi:hypothetical protein